MNPYKVLFVLFITFKTIVKITINSQNGCPKSFF